MTNLLDVLTGEIKAVSSLTKYEYIVILATVEASFVNAFNCNKCIASLKRRNADLLHAKQKAKGCFDLETKSFIIGNPFKEDPVTFKSCVGNFTALSVNYWSDLYFNFEKGEMPFNGKLGEQPAKVIELFRVLEKRINANKEQQENKQKVKRGR